MPIKIQCGACGAGLKAPDHVAGQSLPCPKCGQPILVKEEEKLELVFDDSPELDDLFGATSGDNPAGLAAPVAQPVYQQSFSTGPMGGQAAATKKSRLGLYVGLGGAGAFLLILLLVFFLMSGGGGSDLPGVEGTFAEVPGAEPGGVYHSGEFTPNRTMERFRINKGAVYLPMRMWMKPDGTEVKAVLKNLPDSTKNEVQLETATGELLTLNRADMDEIDNKYLDSLLPAVLAHLDGKGNSRIDSGSMFAERDVPSFSGLPERKSDIDDYPVTAIDQSDVADFTVTDAVQTSLPAWQPTDIPNASIRFDFVGSKGLSLRNNDIVISPDGRLAALATSQGFGTNAKLIVFDLAKSRILAEKQINCDEIAPIAFSLDGRTLVTSHQFPRLSGFGRPNNNPNYAADSDEPQADDEDLGNRNRDRPRRPPGFPDFPDGFPDLSDGIPDDFEKRLGQGFGDQDAGFPGAFSPLRLDNTERVIFWDVDAAKQTITAQKTWQGPMGGFRFGSFVDDKRLTLGGHFAAAIFDVEQNKLLQLTDGSNTNYLPGGSRYSFGQFRNGRIYDLDWGTVTDIDFGASLSPMNSIISPDGRYLASGNPVVSVYDVTQNGKAVLELRPKHSFGSFTFVGNRYLLIGEHLWDLETRAPVVHFLEAEDLHPLITNDGRKCVYKTIANTSRSASALVAAEFLTPKLEAKIDNYKSLPQREVGPGTEVQIMLTGFDAGLRNEIVSHYRDAGWNIVEEADILIECQVKHLKQETIDVVSGERGDNNKYIATVTYTPTRTKCKVTIDGRVYIDRERLNQPPRKLSGSGSVQSMVDRYCKPHSSFFTDGLQLNGTIIFGDMPEVEVTPHGLRIK